MKKFILMAVMMVCGLGLMSACVTVHTWPDYERSAEDKMAVIQTKIGDGLKTGALTPDQSQMYLTRLKDIRLDYEGLRGREVHREDWTRLHARLDTLQADIDSAISRTPRVDESRNGDRIAALQRRIDDGRISGRLPVGVEREYQARLDSIRTDYLRMTAGGRLPSYEERADISRRLDMLELDLNKFP